MRRYTWTGSPWLVNDRKNVKSLNKNSLVSFEKSNDKSKEYKKKTGSSLSKILGLINEDEDTDTVSKNTKYKNGYLSDDSCVSDDGIIDRDYLKHRSMKIILRHAKTKEKINHQ